MRKIILSTLTSVAAASDVLTSTGKTGPNELVLRDFDCRFDDGILPYDTWRRSLQAHVHGLIDVSAPYLHIIEERRFQALQECPLAVFFSDAIKTIVCFAQGNACYDFRAAALQEHFEDTPLRILVGTEWPIVSLLNSELWRLSARDDFSLVECHDDPLFSRLLDVFWGNADDSQLLPSFDEEWFGSAVRFSFGHLQDNWLEIADRCPLGFLAANIIRLCICGWTESVCWRNHAEFLSIHLANPDFPVHVLGGSRWPILAALEYAAYSVKRHGFQVDFREQELLTDNFVQLDDLHLLSPAYSTVLEYINMHASHLYQKFSDAKFTIVSMVHGVHFSEYIGRFVARAVSVGVRSMVLFTLDEISEKVCNGEKVKYDGKLECVRGEVNIMNKFLLPLAFLNNDVDVLWVDFDVFFVQDPTPYVLETAYSDRSKRYDVLVSGSFSAECVCSGVVFYRSSPKTKVWLRKLVVWMYEHPYEHDQKLVSAFLFAGERVAFAYELPVSPEDDMFPNWGYLESGNQFVSARHVEDNGWTGNMEDIVLFHFLHGRSETTRTQLQNFTRDDNWLPLMDIFYNNTRGDMYVDGKQLPWQASREIHDALMKSRLDSRPPDPLPRCAETIPMNY